MPNYNLGKLSSDRVALNRLHGTGAPILDIEYTVLSVIPQKRALVPWSKHVKRLLRGKGLGKAQRARDLHMTLSKLHQKSWFTVYKDNRDGTFIAALTDEGLDKIRHYQLRHNKSGGDFR